MVIDLFSTPERLGHVWLEKSEPDEGFTLGPAALQGIRKLLAPIGALQLLADDVALPVSEQLGEKITTVQAVIDISERFLGDDPLFEHSSLWADKERDAMEGIHERFKEELEYCRKRALEAEEALAAAGWKFNPATGKVTRIAAGAADFLRECVRIIFVEKYQAEYHQLSLLKKLSIRKKIAKELSPYFGAKELSPKSGALIDATIRKI